MTENERIKEVRKKYSLTMESFGARVGLKKSAISLVESGRNSVSDQLRTSVCREFNVSEKWLRTGDGEMMNPEGDAASIFASEHGLDKIEEVLIREYLLLKDDERNVFRKYLKRVLDELNDEAPAAYQEQDQNNSQVVAESHTKYNA